MDVDVHPGHVRVLIKGQLLQLVLPAEIAVDLSNCVRSQASGDLVVTMPTVQSMRPVTRFNGSSELFSLPVNNRNCPSFDLLLRPGGANYQTEETTARFCYEY